MVRSGFLVLDKPEGITSHDLINRARRVLGTRKVGHAGTLDPMATGVMVLGVESATRLLDYVMAGQKRYLATIKVGTLTVTDDREGDPLESVTVDEALMAEAERRLRSMIGKIEQIPSRVSAIKVDGKRAYDRVRSGEEVALKPRAVEIFELRITARRGEEFDIDVTCSAGTYIRAIARDCGGHLTSLRRIESQPFTLDDCTTLDSPTLIPPRQGLGLLLPLYAITFEEQLEISLGRSISFRESELLLPEHGAMRADVIGAISPSEELVALLKPIDASLQPFVVLPESRHPAAK
jgi:tRNA pseudouridine55 synthase